MVVSLAPTWARPSTSKILISHGGRTDLWAAYGQSKTADVLFTVGCPLGS
ncbi:hypothetical protein ACQ87O_00050 [Streptomyces lividans]